MEINELPQVLTSVIGTQSCDFAVKAGLRRPLKKSLGDIAIGLLFTVVTGIFAVIFLEARKTPVDGQSDTPMIAVLSLFLIIGITLMVSGIIKAFRSGGYFVGTPKQLIHYKNGKHSLIEWQKFAGDTQVTGNDRNGTITLVLRPENMSNAESESAYAPSVIYITAVRDALEIERKIWRRIKENDPKPAVH